MEATRKLISKSGEVFASPVTYLASYVIPTEKRTAGELHTLNEILKLSGAGGSGEKTKGDAASNESNAVLGLPSALLWSGNVLHGNTHDRGNNPNNSGNEGKGNTTITQTLDRMWTVLDEHGRAKNLKASKRRVAAAFGVPLRDLHYLDPLRPTLTPANIFIRPKCLIVNLEHMKFIVTAEIALFLNAESLEVKRFVKFLRKYLKEVEIAQTQKREDLVKEATMMETIIRDENENETQKLQQSNSALKNAQTTTKIKEERVLHLPLELLVLECAMHELGLVLDNETIALEREAAPCMEKMLQSVQAEELAEGRRIKEKLNALILRLEAFTEALSSILEHDESLDAMCLSKLKVMELVRGDDISTTAAPDDDNENESAPRMGAAATAQTTTTKKSSKKAQFITRVISNPTGMTMNEEKEYDPENEEEFETIDSTNEEDGHEHEGAEALLEAYFMHSAATQKRAHALKDLLQNTEAVSSMILDRQRNELIKIDLVVSAALFACSIVSVAGSIFGMNLQSNLETKSGFFVGVIVVTSCVKRLSVVSVYHFLLQQKKLV